MHYCGDVAGVSLGGIHTSIAVPKFGMVFDCGIPLREFAAHDHMFLSHGHADHIGALWSYIGLRDLTGKKVLNVYLPAEILDDVLRIQASFINMFRYEPRVVFTPVRPGDTFSVNGKTVTAFRTYHPIPALGYLVTNHVKKLKPEFIGLDSGEIIRLKTSGVDISNVVDVPELAYVTDTTAKVLLDNPELLNAKTLILECTFLDDWKNQELAHQACHIHIDDLRDLRYDFQNQQVVLMHFSQKYSPAMVRNLTRVLHEERPNVAWKTLLPHTEEW